MSVQLQTALIALITAAVAAVIAGWLTRLLKISEFRQNWINALRDDIAAYLGVTQKWFKAYSKGEEDWKLFSLGNEASIILFRIQMRFNPNENEFKQEDDEFLAALNEIRNPHVVIRELAESHWGNASVKVMSLARKILKTKRFFVWPWTPQN